MADGILITTAGGGMADGLKRLWKLAFGDSEGYISLFFEKRFAPPQCVAALDGEKAVGMLFMLPFALRQKNARYDGRYIYAVATHPDYRRRGISGAMLDFAHQKAREEGAALSVLVPANGGLFEYYRKRGFETEFYKREVGLWPAREAGDVGLERARLEDMLALRREIFSESRAFVDWDEGALAYQQLENSLLGGFTLRFCRPKEGYALCLPSKDGIFIREWGGRELYPEVIAAISAGYQKHKKGRVTVRLAAGKDDEGALPFAMTKWYISERETPRGGPAFISLVLD